MLKNEWSLTEFIFFHDTKPQISAWIKIIIITRRNGNCFGTARAIHSIII